MEEACYHTNTVFLWTTLSTKKKNDILSREESFNHVFILLLMSTAINMLQIQMITRRKYLNNFMIQYCLILD